MRAFKRTWLQQHTKAIVFYYSKVRMSILVTMQLHLSSLDQPLLSICFSLLCCDTSIIKIKWL